MSLSTPNSGENEHPDLEVEVRETQGVDSRGTWLRQQIHFVRDRLRGTTSNAPTGGNESWKEWTGHLYHNARGKMQEALGAGRTRTEQFAGATRGRVKRKILENRVRLNHVLQKKLDDRVHRAPWKWFVRPKKKPERNLYQGSLKEMVRNARTEVKKHANDPKPATLLSESPLKNFPVRERVMEEGFLTKAGRWLGLIKKKEEAPHSVMNTRILANEARVARSQAVTKRGTAVEPQPVMTADEASVSDILHESVTDSHDTTSPPVRMAEAWQRIQDAFSARGISEEQAHALGAMGLVPNMEEKNILMDRAFLERFAAEIPTPSGRTRSSFGNDLVTTERAAQLLGVTTDDIDHAGFSMDEAFLQAHLYFPAELLQSTINAIQRITPRQITEAERLQHHTDDSDSDTNLKASVGNIPKDLILLLETTDNSSDDLDSDSLLEEKDKEFLLSASDELFPDDDSSPELGSGSGLNLNSPRDSGLNMELNDSAAFDSGVIEQPSLIADAAGPSPLRWKEEQQETTPESPEERIKLIYRWAREQDQWKISGARFAELVGVPEEELAMRILLHPDDSYTINDAVDLLRESAAELIPIPESPEDRIAYLRQRGEYIPESLAARLLGVSLINFRQIAKAEGVDLLDSLILTEDEIDEDECESDSIIHLIEKREVNSQGDTPTAVKKDEEFLLSPSDEMFNDAGTSAQLDSDMELDSDDDAIDPDLLEDDDEPLDLEDLSSTAGQASTIEATSRLSPNLSWAPRQSHQFIGLEEAARIIGITPDALVEMRSNGDIRGFRDGARWRFKEDEVGRVRDEMVEKNSVVSEADQVPDLGGDSIPFLELLEDEDLF